MQEKCEGHAKIGREGNACQEAIGFAIPPSNYVKLCRKNALIFSPISCTVFLLFS